MLKSFWAVTAHDFGTHVAIVLRRRIAVIAPRLSRNKLDRYVVDAILIHAAFCALKIDKFDKICERTFLNQSQN